MAKELLNPGFNANFTFSNEKGIKMDVVGYAALFN